MASAAIDRHGHRDGQPEEGRDRAGPIDGRRLEHLARQAGHVVAQQVDRERQPVARVGQPQGEELAVEAELAEQLEHRHEGRLKGHHEETDDDHEQDVAAGELHPGERVGGEGGHEDRDHGGRDGDEQAVDEALPEAALGQHVGVVVEGDLRGLEDDVPPSGGLHGVRRPERVDQQPDRRDQPDDEQDDHDHMGREVPQRTAPARCGGGRAGQRGRGRGHRISSWAWKRRMLRAMIGMMATIRTMARALPFPKSPLVNSCSIMALAMTCVSKLPLVMT